MKSSKRITKKKIAGIIISTVLLAYSVTSIIPFYFLGIRSFIPTIRSTEFHLIPPELDKFNIKSTYGDLATYYNVDLREAKKAFGISGYIDPNLTWEEISEEYNIPREKLEAYFNPYVKYNGWITILTDERILHSIVMTVILTFSSLITGGLFSIMTGSVLAGFKKKWHSWIYNMYLLEMIITPVMIILPVYMILGVFFGLGNSYWSIFLIFAKGGALPVMVFTSYIASIPGSLRESVEIDGGNRLQYFIHILLPLTKVPFATYAAIKFPKFWNDLLQGLVFLNEKKYTITPLISSLQGSYTTNFQAIYAGLALSIIPVILIYMIFQNLFVQSALSGSLKG